MTDCILEIFDGDDFHQIEVSRKTWALASAGEKMTIEGQGYSSDGVTLEDFWRFNDPAQGNLFVCAEEDYTIFEGAISDISVQEAPEVVSVIHRSVGDSTLSSHAEQLNLLFVSEEYVLNQTRSEGSEQMLVHQSDSFTSGEGFWQAFDENAEFGGLDDDQLVMDSLDDIRSHSGRLASEIETELRRRQE
jgi:hypothetical protein